MSCRRPEEKIRQLGPELAAAIDEVNRINAEAEFVTAVWNEIVKQRALAIQRRNHLAHDLGEALRDRGSDGAGAFWVGKS